MMQKKLKFTKVMEVRKAQVTSSKEQQMPEELWLSKTRGAAEQVRVSVIHYVQNEGRRCTGSPFVGTASSEVSPAPTAA